MPDVQEASPTLNQEVVATLFEVLLTHEDVTAAIEHALKSHEQSQARALPSPPLPPRTFCLLYFCVFLYIAAVQHCQRVDSR